MSKHTIRFQIGRSKKNREFYWRIRAANGEIIAQGEGYKRRAGAQRVFDILADAFDHMTVRVQDLDDNGLPVADVQFLGTMVVSKDGHSCANAKKVPGKKCCGGKPVSVKNW